jgi:hypothetical protein
MNAFRRSTFVFLVLQKNGLIKSYYLFKYLPAHGILWSDEEWYKFYIHLRILNFLHLERLKIRN